MTAEELRTKRIMQRIPTRLIAPRAHLSCSRLSDIERGYVSPSQVELLNIARALDELIAARAEVRALASRVGWPVESI
jgi:transcriptional regulator with XRE-family HTH domain